MLMPPLPQKMGIKYHKGGQNGDRIKNDDGTLHLFLTFQITNDRGHNAQTHHKKINRIENLLHLSGLVKAKIGNKEQYPENTGIEGDLKKDLGVFQIKKIIFSDF